MSARPGIRPSQTKEKRHAMSTRIPKTQYEQLLEIAEWYECSYNEAIAHCIKQTHQKLFQDPEKREPWASTFPNSSKHRPTLTLVPPS